MKHFAKISSDLPVDQALQQLEDRAELWGQHPQRTAPPDSPHAQSQDIWLRFRAERDLHEPADYGVPHFAEFYPAWQQLPALHPLVFGVMHAMHSTYLGGILITRIPAGAAILPHVDRGWHPEFLDTKVYIILKANDRCINRCADENVVMAAGEAWLFRNDIVHSVENHGSDERIAVICTMRTK